MRTRMSWDCNCAICVRRQRQVTLGAFAVAAAIFGLAGVAVRTAALVVLHGFVSGLVATGAAAYVRGLTDSNAAYFATLVVVLGLCFWSATCTVMR